MSPFRHTLFSHRVLNAEPLDPGAVAGTRGSFVRGSRREFGRSPSSGTSCGPPARCTTCTSTPPTGKLASRFIFARSSRRMSPGFGRAAAHRDPGGSAVCALALLAMAALWCRRAARRVSSAEPGCWRRCRLTRWCRARRRCRRTAPPLPTPGPGASRALPRR